ncbi:MAG: hypothetical protein ACD_44C00127G0003 [uncultured bacterium]|nr:MAG: hypothetical protein ACD_44C00127G0003 [uncultured bacterium]OGT24226.1 MAG: hypothetical protein A2W47_06630 [Gammaproteobacteria bacterium RIFCSPHIGHO2_12_38_15]OGT67533.1 MAG: hypothetical protein A3I12_06110 [Gammaproteobacteria bacterium RIFCSPLOWO2_02_FULL_38_11]
MRILVVIISFLISSIAVAQVERASFIFDNRDTSSYLSYGTWIYCSTSGYLRDITGDVGYAAPGEYHVISYLTDSLIIKKSRFYLYMTQDCSGPALTKFTFTNGSVVNLDPVDSGPYHFTGFVNGVKITCRDGSKNC